MMSFGASFVQNNDSDDNRLTNDRSLGRHLGAIFSYKDVMQQKPALPYLKDVWLPDVQVMVARTQEGSPDNFFVSAKRNIHFDRNKSVEIRDEYELNSLTGPMTQTLMTAFSAKKVKPGRIKISSRSASKPAEAFILFDHDQFEVNIEEIPITDRRLQQAWDAPLSRVLFTAKDPKQKDDWKLIITQNDNSPAKGQ